MTSNGPKYPKQCMLFKFHSSCCRCGLSQHHGLEARASAPFNPCHHFTACSGPGPREKDWPANYLALKKPPWLISLGHRATVLLQCLEERLLLNLSLLRAQERDDHSPQEQKGASRENEVCSSCLFSLPCTVCSGRAPRARCWGHSSSWQEVLSPAG